MIYFCSLCKKRISEGVYRYSLKHFGKALCMDHQKASQNKVYSSEKTSQKKKQYYCNECKKTITYAEFKYSMRYFDRALCRDCQPIREKKMSVPPRRELDKTSRIEFGGKWPEEERHRNGW
jgi:hypothetical protein